MYQIKRLLKIARAMHGLSRGAMAVRLGISREHYNNLESGKVTPGVNVLRKFSRSTGLSMEAILILNTSAPRELDLDHKAMYEKVRESITVKFIMNKVIGGEE